MENAIARAAQQVGGQTRLADLLGINKQQVNAWVKDRENIPIHHVRRIAELTDVSREDLRPDVYA